MTRVTFNLAKMRAASFRDSPRYNLDRAAQMLLPEVPASAVSDAEVVAQLCAACNIPLAGPQVAPGEEPMTNDRPSDANVIKMPTVGKLGKIPNLSSTGRWEGRRRLVQFARHAGNPEGTISLAWDGQKKWTIATPDTVNMPWPYWQRVKDSVLVDAHSDEVRQFERNRRTKQLEVTIEPRYTPVYTYVDLGDVPGTEDLPTSYFDFFLKEGLKSECFKGYPRSALILIYTKLRDNPGSNFFENKDPIWIRQKIAAILGPQMVQMMDDEVYAAESA